jgi:hypothetical protein
LWPQVSLQWKPEAALTVVMAANGYPGSYQKGSVIRGLDDVKTAKVRKGGGAGRGGFGSFCWRMDGAVEPAAPRRHAPRPQTDAQALAL